jgi:peptidoglycan/xylan/chitin deacetylase (PgdA/CDA1 family)
MTSNWERFISKSREYNIPVCIGIISKNMTSAATKARVKELALSRNNDGKLLIQFWNHGYDHSRINKIEEFKTPDLAYQIEHIQLAQEFLKDSLDIDCDTFSTPYNESSVITFDALKLFPKIKIWMCYQQQEKQFHSSWIDPNLNKLNAGYAQILLDVHCLSVNYVPTKSVKLYLERNKQLSYLVIQIHPNVWKDQEFNDYKALIEYLKLKKMNFMTPHEYYDYLVSL